MILFDCHGYLSKNQHGYKSDDQIVRARRREQQQHANLFLSQIIQHKPLNVLNLHQLKSAAVFDTKSQSCQSPHARRAGVRCCKGPRPAWLDKNYHKGDFDIAFVFHKMNLTNNIKLFTSN